MEKSWIKGIANILGTIVMIGVQMAVILIRWDDLKDYFKGGEEEA